MRRYTFECLMLTALVTSTLCGCGDKPAAAPAKPGAATATGSDSAGTDATPPESIAAESADPAAAASEPASAAPATSDSAQTPSAKPTPQKAASSKPTAKPSAAQIEKWKVVDAEPLQLLACYDGFGDAFVQCLDVTPNGKQFVLGGVKLTLWNPAESTPTLDLLETIKGDGIERPILAVGVSPDGELLAAGDSKGKLRVWKLSDQSELFDIQAHDARLTELAFSPDSKTLATTSYGGEVRLWNLADGKKRKNIKIDDQEIHRLVFLSDTQLATAGREAAIWDVESGKKQTSLTKGNVIGPALGLSDNRHWLVYNDGDSQTKVWDVEKGAAAGALPGAGAHWIDFSPDGKWIATYSGDSNVRIWDAATRSVVQVIDADGERTAGLKWLAGSGALVIASEQRVRIWGTPETAKALGVEPLAQPKLRTIAADAKRSFVPAQFDEVIDIRSFPRLPDAMPSFGFGGMDSYNTPASQPEAELFYRYYLGKAGWEEITAKDPMQPGLNFRKDGCLLSVAVSPTSSPTPGREKDQQVALRFAGNYDVRWLPKISPTNSKSSYSSFSTVGYRTKESLTDVEVAILKKFHDAGWIPYTRLGASSAEDPLSRSISMLQGGSVLTVSIGRPADAADELFVQTGLYVSNKALPIPPDSGWIEFDSSNDLMMVANTKMDMDETIAFYDKEMALDGWIAREAGRKVNVEDEEKKEKRSWLPYIRGQQDVLIRLVSLASGGTRVIVGDAERSSYQLAAAKPAESKTEPVGIQAADFKLPKGATAVKFDVDAKQIQFDFGSAPAPKLAEQFAKQMEALGWERDGAGIISDEYSFVTYKQGRQEIQLRARGDNKKTTAMISGDGLLWSKTLPTAPERISYETWLRRNHKPATLDLLDEFAAEMKKIPASGGKGK